VWLTGIPMSWRSGSDFLRTRRTRRRRKAKTDRQIDKQTEAKC
jgi:hypothetical protein